MSTYFGFKCLIIGTYCDSSLVLISRYISLDASVWTCTLVQVSRFAKAIFISMMFFWWMFCFNPDPLVVKCVQMYILSSLLLRINFQNQIIMFLKAYSILSICYLILFFLCQTPNSQITHKHQMEWRRYIAFQVKSGFCATAVCERWTQIQQRL